MSERLRIRLHGTGRKFHDLEPFTSSQEILEYMNRERDQEILARQLRQARAVTKGKKK